MRTASPGPGKWLALDNFLRQPEFEPGLANFVLEQLPQRFDQLEVHLLRQAADIVMALDHVRRIAADGNALDHVGIKRALSEEFVATVLVRAVSSVFG